MKTRSPMLLPAVAITAFYAFNLTGGLALAQATTDPVGFIDLSVSGPATAGAYTLSLISPTLTQPILWQGAITVISGTTITVGNAPWSANQFNGAAGSHYVEIVSTATPANSGTLSDITGTTASTITTQDNLSTRAAVGDIVRIRKDVTIADLLGATNSAGLLSSAGDATTADEVLIYSGASSTSYFYYTGPGLPAGWYNSTTFDSAGGIAIAPSEAVVIKRKAVGNVTISFSGSVKTGNTLIPIVNGLNVLGTASAKGLTLATSGLYTGNNATGVMPSSADATTADEIILYSGTSQTSYFYYTGPGLPAGWYNSTSFDSADNIAIVPGTAFVLRRKGGAPFNWALPSPTSF